MKHFTFLFFLALSTFAFAQAPFESFSVSIEPLIIADAPGVHSYVWAKSSDGKWLIFGGRLDGLHPRQPWGAFTSNLNNSQAFVLDPIAETVWERDLSELPAPIYEQLQSTNQNFIQVGNNLVTTGGYGYSVTKGDHLTFPNMTIIDVDGMVGAIVASQSVVDFVVQVEDSLMAVTGGQMGFMNGNYFLVGGQEFNGRYNPMGPNHGPGFYQKYTGEVRKFQLDLTGMIPVVAHLVPMTDTTVLPRRDYNMSPQVFVDGSHGFTIFTGVFKHPGDTPFFDIVNVTENNYEVVPNFTQLLSQYHSAKIPMYDVDANVMHTIFFGGMAQYYYNDSGTLVNDEDVPFVKTISRVTRLADGSYEEVKLDVEMPSLVGAGAEFIPVDSFFDEEILNYQELPKDNKTLVGYIYGGIHSDAPNIFFSNNSGQSFASNTIFKVYVDNTVVGLKELKSNGIFDFTLSPNPITNGRIFVNFRNPSKSKVKIELFGMNGQKLDELFDYTLSTGTYRRGFELNHLSNGQYLMTISNGMYSQTKAFVKQ